MYPTNATALILGRKLIAFEHNLFLFCPQDVHKRQAHTIPDDLRIASVGLQSTVTVLDSLDTLESIRLIVFPTLDVWPENKRIDFSETCRELFQ